MDFAALGWIVAAAAVAAALVLLAAAAAYALGRRATAGRAAAAPPAAAADAAWRAEVEDEIEALRAEAARLREEVSALRVARGAAPQYGEAMALAHSGLDAEAIAERCGISVAEAELVRSIGARRNSPTGG
ncbi:MAG: hypothetical protein AUK49_12415 [Betaproteobacteria bacterium CG2_30_68_42]|nr:MAG: hypothetical protein AUK49_12415 [Betaproteobacteria bacterium CG2_30_68_42]